MYGLAAPNKTIAATADVYIRPYYAPSFVGSVYIADGTSKIFIMNYFVVIY